MPNAAIYARVSTDEQTKGYSLSTQIQDAERYCQEMGYQIAQIFAEDCTGTVMSRPKLDILRSLARTKAVQVVVVHDLDRLSRVLLHQLLLENELQASGVRVEYVLSKFEATPEGDLQKQIKSVIAQYEREKIRERSIRGKRGRAEAGKSNSSISLYGYTLVDGKYTTNEEEAQVVRRIHSLYSSPSGAHSLAAIAKILTEENTPTPRSTRLPGTKVDKYPGLWGPTSILRILQNRVYTGELRYLGASGEYSDKIVIRIPPIITVEQWIETQRCYAERKINPHRNATVNDILLHGMAYCGICGNRIYIANTTSARGNWVYYRCKQSNLSDPTCNLRIWPARTTDPAIWAKLLTVLADEGKIKRHLEKARLKEVPVIKLKFTQASLDTKRKRLIEMFVEGHLNRDQFNQEIKALSDQEFILKSQAEPPHVDTPEQIFNMIKSIQLGLEALTHSERREVLGILKVKASFYQHKLVIESLLPTIEIDKPKRQKIASIPS